MKKTEPEAAPAVWRETHAPARFWSKLADGAVQCHLSPRNCVMKEGQRGFCGVRQNLGGELRSLSYGKAVQATQEFVETEAIYHYAPGARILSMGNLGCMMNCDYCHNWKTSQARNVRDQDVRYYTPEAVVELCLALEVPILSWTYNDPVVWQEFVVDTARLARRHGILNLYKSAFYISPEAAGELTEHMDIFSLSLKSMDEGFYRRLTKGTLPPVLEAIKIVAASGKHLEISNLMVTDANDGLEDAWAVARWVLDHCPPSTPLHYVRFHPDYKYLDVGRTPIDRLERAREQALEMGLPYVYMGNVADHPGVHSYCPGCRKRVVTRFGMNTVPDGLGPDGACLGCHRKLPFAGLAVSAADRARRRGPAVPVGPDGRRHVWADDILSVHVTATNPSDAPLWVSWTREGAPGGDGDAVQVPPRTTHRFVVARSGASETAFTLWSPPGTEVLDLLDRAHFPTAV